MAPTDDLEKALGDLYKARDKAPGDPSVLRQIQVVRDQLTSASIDRLRPLDRVVHRIGASTVDTPAEAYVLDQCVDGSATIDVVLDRSTLGRHRTAAALEGLVRVGAIELRSDKRSIAPKSAFGARAEPSAIAVVIGDVDATQTTLTRTMTRTAMHGMPGLTGARFHGATSGLELVEVAAKERAALVVTSFQLPGFDALEALRRLRLRLRAVSAVVLVERLDAGFVGPKVPEGAVTLVRPFDKVGMQSALAAAMAWKG